MSCTVKRNWLLGGYEATFALQRPLLASEIPATTHSLLSGLHRLCGELTTTNEILNLKGRESSEVLLANCPPPLPDEVVTIGGTIATGENANGFVWTPFRFSLVSYFARFEGSSSIVFSLQPSRTDSLPEWLPWWLLGAAAPLRVDYMRLGLEVFTSKFSISSFGSIPAVSDSLLIDIAHGTLALKLTTQQRRKGRCNPFESVIAFKQISDALASFFGAPLSSQFASELEATGLFTL